MAKINKLYPSFYNGESEQSPELILDTQCRKMVNTSPSIITGATRRNGTEGVLDILETGLASQVFHSYDRGDGNEEYIFVKTSNASDPLRIFTKDGVERTVTYTDVTATNAYLGSVGDLKGLTLQDRTYILSKDKTITETTVTANSVDYDKEAYYWLKRSSNDVNNDYNYAVYIDNITFQFASDKSDDAATGLRGLINAHANYTATALGSVIKVVRTDGGDFTFSSWDSWGNQASFGWKGSAPKLSDLPDDMPFDDVYVNITGDDKNSFNDYFVAHTTSGSKWTETKDPTETRGVLGTMPIQVTRQGDGSFVVDVIEWEAPHVGSTDTNPSPSFLGSQIVDLFFYKNRLGFASGDNVILSETGGYSNFYIKTVLEVLDDDPIDVAVASTQASKVYHVKPFQRGLFVFTKDTQFELISEGSLSPVSVSIVSVSNYSMDVDVEPIVSGTSLYFISLTGDNKSQLREYLKDEDSLVSKGVNVTLSVPNMLPKIDKMILNSTLGFIGIFSSTTPDTLYIYKTESTGAERVQSALHRWEFGFDILAIYLFDSDVYFMSESLGTTTNLMKLGILPISGDKEDATNATGGTMDFITSIEMPQWMPKLGAMKSPRDNVQIKRVTMHGTGQFNVDIFRKGYNTTISRTYTSGSLKDASASIAGRSDDVVITIKSNLNKDFNIDSISLEGNYKQSSKEVQ